MKDIVKKLSLVQVGLKAPKSQYNNFGKYSYRSCEDILEAVKPLLNECIITISDDIKIVGDRVYVVATSVFSDGEDEIKVTAFARESLSKKGMDESQITGAASSYARKYSLNGLLLIDDTKDSDTSPLLTNEERLKSASTIESLGAIYKSLNKADQTSLKSLVSKLKLELENGSK